VCAPSIFWITWFHLSTCGYSKTVIAWILVWNSWSAFVWQELAPILEKNKGITKLQLNSVNLGDEVIWHIQWQRTMILRLGLELADMRFYSCLLVKF
jgi:hypothetical protein